MGNLLAADKLRNSRRISFVRCHICRENRYRYFNCRMRCCSDCIFHAIQDLLAESAGRIRETRKHKIAELCMTALSLYTMKPKKKYGHKRTGEVHGVRNFYGCCDNHHIRCFYKNFDIVEAAEAVKCIF